MMATLRTAGMGRVSRGGGCGIKESTLSPRGRPRTRGDRGGAGEAATPRSSTLPRMPEARVKIVATLGPASYPPAVLAAVARAGADVIRINGAHTPPKDVAARIAAVGRASRRAGRPLAALVDLPGVKLRVGAFPAGGIDPREGWRVALAAGAVSRPGSVPGPSAVVRSLNAGRGVLFVEGGAGLRTSSVPGGRAGGRA